MSAHKLDSIALSFLLVVAAPGSGAMAETEAGQGPIDITADSMEVIQSQCLSIWRGRAEALQDESRLRADTMRVFGEQTASGRGGECREIKRIEAEGSVFYVSRSGQRARGDSGVYDLAAQSVTLSGDVVAVQGQNVLTGGRMTFDTATGVGHLTGKGGGQAGRPRAVFFPKSRP